MASNVVLDEVVGKGDIAFYKVDVSCHTIIAFNCPVHVFEDFFLNINIDIQTFVEMSSEFEKSMYYTNVFLDVF